MTPITILICFAFEIFLPENREQSVDSILKSTVTLSLKSVTTDRLIDPTLLIIGYYMIAPALITLTFINTALEQGCQG